MAEEILKDNQAEEQVVENNENSQENEQLNIDKLSVKQARSMLKESVDLIKQLQEQLTLAQKQAEDNKNDYLRARADCENVRKRKAEDVKYARDDGKMEAVTKILPIGDSLVWALQLPMEEKTREGIDMLLKKYHESLEKLGLVEFSPEVNTAFDPNTAQAVMQVEKVDEDDAEGNVKTVFAKGYKLGDKIVRYAQVSVIK